jgi:hypothetical protein
VVDPASGHVSGEVLGRQCGASEGCSIHPPSLAQQRGSGTAAHLKVLTLCLCVQTPVGAVLLAQWMHMHPGSQALLAAAHHTNQDRHRVAVPPA